MPLGLADGCRLVLRRQGERALSAREVREELDAIGVDLSRLSNQLASIHVTLKRLAAAGEVRFIRGVDGTSPMYAPVARGSTPIARERASAMVPFFSAAEPPVRPKRKKKA